MVLVKPLAHSQLTRTGPLALLYCKGSAKSGIVIFSAPAGPASSVTQFDQDISNQAVYEGSGGYV